MKKNRTLMTAVGLVLLTATAVRAETSDSSSTNSWWGERMCYQHETGHLFNANEGSFDLFGTYLYPENRIETPFTHGNVLHHGTWGGGVGGNYFFSREAGFGVDTSFQADSSKFVNHVGGNFMLRFPIEQARLAPYIFGGGGREFDPINRWFGDAGAGLEFRLNHKMGIFGDARYIWTDRVAFAGSRGEPSRDEVLIRAGLRVGF